MSISGAGKGDMQKLFKLMLVSSISEVLGNDSHGLESRETCYGEMLGMGQAGVDCGLQETIHCMRSGNKHRLPCLSFST